MLGMFLFTVYSFSLLNSICLDTDNKSALLQAVSTGHFDIVKYLGDKGGNLDQQGMFTFSEHAFLFKFSHLDKSGKSALAQAAAYGHFDIVRYLVDKGAQIDLQGMFLFS